MENKKEKVETHHLTVNIPKTLFKELNLELVYRFDKIRGNMGKSVIEAIEQWIKKSRESRNK